ncbi:uncharacterized protein LOC142626025 [Castanea sativa]|uniref:uncharacterized protein LOC142626025 n=1 Tax=Castanea sativa TaxID=21020 RepID=UPI003F64EC83
MAYCNLLPTKENLVRRIVIEDPLCDRCKCVNESTLHALWSCSELDVVLEDLTSWNCRRTTSFINFKELLSWLIKNQKHLEIFSVTTWSIWTQQNQVRLHKPSFSPHLITPLAKERLHEFKVVNPSPSSTQNVSSSTRNRWLPPVQGMVKINCDGANFSKENKTGIGVVIRDSRGLVLGSLFKQVPQAYRGNGCFSSPIVRSSPGFPSCNH